MTAAWRARQTFTFVTASLRVDAVANGRPSRAAPKI